MLISTFTNTLHNNSIIIILTLRTNLIKLIVNSKLKSTKSFD